jgi:hypothetical protein
VSQIFCPRCGNTLASEANFCVSCGEKSAKRPSLKREHYLVLLLLVLVVHAALLAGNLNRPFGGVNEDDNALYGLGALNLAKFGFVPLKFGMATQYVDSREQVGTQFYTHHPQWFIVPTALLYKFLGVSEWTTRLAPILFTVLSLTAFSYSVYLYYGNRRLAVLSAAVYALLPGVIHYGGTLSEKVFVIAFSNFAILGFLLYRKYQNRPTGAAFIGVVFLGGLQGWHFYFIPVALWLYTLWHKRLAGRRFLLWVLPAVSVFTFGANFAHFYWLKGAAFTEILDVFALRTSRTGLDYAQRHLFWLNHNFTEVAFIIATGFLLYSFYRLAARREFGLPLIYAVQPLLTLIFFQQWTTSHGFGPIYWAPFAALSVGFALNRLLAAERKRWISVALVIFVFFVSLVPGKLAVFRSPSLLTEYDAMLLNQIAREEPAVEVAMATDYRGFAYREILEWYLRRRLVDWQDKQATYVIGFDPSAAPASAEQTKEIVDTGYALLGYSGRLSLLERQ